MKGRSGAGPLHLLAGSFSPQGYSTTQVLLERGEDPNSQDVDGLTPVHVAAYWGNYEILRLFLLAGGIPEICDSEQKTAFNYAKENEQWDCLNLLNSWRNSNNNQFEDAGTGEADAKVQNGEHRGVQPKSCQTFHKAGTMQEMQINPEQDTAKTSRTKSKLQTPRLSGNRRRPVELNCCAPFCILTFCSDSSSIRSDSPPYANAESTFTGERSLNVKDDLSSICKGVRRSLKYSKTTENAADLEQSVRAFEEETKIDPTVLEECHNLEDKALRNCLMELGIDVGPISANTRWLYVRKLATVMMEERDTEMGCTGTRKYSLELDLCLSGTAKLGTAKEDEMCLGRFFNDPSNMRGWREGRQKMSFCYLLLDSRVTQNLPVRSKALTYSETFAKFLESIFYIGKGKKSRPYQHLVDAAEYQSDGGEKPKSDKIGRIMDIWNAGKGVVSVQVFHDIIPVEAYTREAAMIDAVGLHNLTNAKRGDYYGLASGWTATRRRKFGVFLLDQVLNIFLLGMERELFLDDVKS